MSVVDYDKAKEVFGGKSVSLVGRAASILEHGDGKRIDSSDVVVRVNWMLPLEQDPTRVGTRTDVIIHADLSRVKVREAAAQHGCLAWNRDRQSPFEWARVNKFYLSKPPQAGILSLFMLQKVNVSKVYLTGYDFYTTGQATKNYIEKHDGLNAEQIKFEANKIHSVEQDKLIFLKFYEQNKSWIELDEVLQKIIEVET